MPITCIWDTPSKTTILVEFDGRWTWGEFRDNEPQLTQMVTSVDHTVHIILWFKSFIPINDAISELRKGKTKEPKNVGKTIIINSAGSMFLEIINDLFNKLYGGNKHIMVDSLEQARSLLGYKEENPS
jgi:hypothetical protein